MTGISVKFTIFHQYPWILACTFAWKSKGKNFTRSDVSKWWSYSVCSFCFQTLLNQRNSPLYSVTITFSYVMLALMTGWAFLVAGGSWRRVKAFLTNSRQSSYNVDWLDDGREAFPLTRQWHNDTASEESWWNISIEVRSSCLPINLEGGGNCRKETKIFQIPLTSACRLCGGK